MDVTINQDILMEAKDQSVSTLIAKDYITLGNNIRLLAAHAELTSLLSGIPFTTMKGYASAFYYPEPAMRPMDDVDFIVHPKYFVAAVDRLLQNGWERKDTKHDRHEPFRKEKTIFELHTEIKGIPNGIDGIAVDSDVAGDYVRDLLSDIIETAVTVETQQGSVIIPDDFHHALIMLLHIAGHMINDGGVGLRHICDWAVFVNQVSVETFKYSLEHAGLWTFACQLTAVCSRYLGLPKQGWTGEWTEEFLSLLIEDVMASGNFSCKDAGRMTALNLERSSFAKMTRKRYPQAKEHPVLLPVFMLINLTRFAVEVFTGKRKIIRPSTLSKAKGRNELYRQFRLYEV